MKTLEQQLRRYGEIVEDSQSTVSLDEVLSDSTVTTLTPVSSPSRSWVWALVSFVLVGVVGVLVWSLTPSVSPTVTQPATVTTVPSRPSTSISTEESSGPPLVESTYVGSETSLGTLRWTLVKGGVNSCPPHIREDEGGAGYYSLWCKGGVLTSADGFDWTPSMDYPSYDDNPEFHYPPPENNTLPPTTPVGATGNTVSYLETNFGWVTSVRQDSSSPRMWISADGQSWEEVKPPPHPDTERRLWVGRGGGAGDLLYWGYVTSDLRDGNYLWIGHFDGETLPVDGLPVVGFEEVGAETSVGTLQWSQVVGPANSCPPTVRIDEERGGYYSLWCRSVLYSEDGHSWVSYDDFPSYEDRRDLYATPQLSELPPTVPVKPPVEDSTGPEPPLDISKVDFGWVASRFSHDAQPTVPIGEREVQIWISTDGFHWEGVDPPPLIDTSRSVWGNAGGGAGDILYFGYVTSDYQDGNYLWVGHFDSR